MYISQNNNNIDAVITLIEILEIKTDNEIILKLKEDVINRLRGILTKVNNPDWLINLILEARKKVKSNLSS